MSKKRYIVCYEEKCIHLRSELRTPDTSMRHPPPLIIKETQTAKRLFVSLLFFDGFRQDLLNKNGEICGETSKSSRLDEPQKVILVKKYVSPLNINKFGEIQVYERPPPNGFLMPTLHQKSGKGVKHAPMLTMK